MRYISTRGEAPALAFDDVLLAGLAEDGGLYVPEAWPRLSPAELGALKGLPYGELAWRVMLPFLGGTIEAGDFAALVRDSYAGFDDEAIVPLKRLGQGECLMELFHGPTLAFKDLALQLVGRLFDYALKRRGERITIVGATSGDTGAAAIAACAGRETIDIFILHPHGRITEIQRRQMTTVKAENVWNIAIEGSFDDCQDLVKGMFNDRPFRDELALAAVNSINWARIMAQIPYYIWAALSLDGLERPLAFAVPSGNFGNVYAGYAARAIGLPVAQLIVGSNRNDILTRFFATGVMELRAVEPSLSPSMDIQISSNFERLLFDLLARDGARVRDAIQRLRRDGRLELARAEWQKALPLFSAAMLDDRETLRSIAEVRRETGELLDPHSIIGLIAGRRMLKEPRTRLVALLTAHPAKFPDAIAAAIGALPPLPPRLQALAGLEERYSILPNNLSAVEGFVRAALARRGKG